MSFHRAFPVVTAADQAEATGSIIYEQRPFEYDRDSTQSDVVLTPDEPVKGRSSPRSYSGCLFAARACVPDSTVASGSSASTGGVGAGDGAATTSMVALGNCFARARANASSRSF
jgi:hypothetical protein